MLLIVLANYDPDMGIPFFYSLTITLSPPPALFYLYFFSLPCSFSSLYIHLLNSLSLSLSILSCFFSIPSFSPNLTHFLPNPSSSSCSAEMLINLSIPWVILGHSERRALLGESNEVNIFAYFFKENTSAIMVILIMLKMAVSKVCWRQGGICSRSRLEGDCLCGRDLRAA